MSFLIGLLTVVLVLDCLLLILLVLIQLPKKEAGAGLAFGAGATDALFGAGSGNVLTKVTKYATIVFFVLAMIVSIMQNHYYHREGTEFKEAVEKQASQPPNQPSQMPAPAVPPADLPAVTSDSTNVPMMPATEPEQSAPATVPSAQE